MDLSCYFIPHRHKLPTYWILRMSLVSFVYWLLGQSFKHDSIGLLCKDSHLGIYFQFIWEYTVKIQILYLEIELFCACSAYAWDWAILSWFDSICAVRFEWICRIKSWPNWVTRLDPLIPGLEPFLAWFPSFAAERGLIFSQCFPMPLNPKSVNTKMNDKEQLCT